MATIASGTDLIVMINTFTVEPEHQQELIDLLIEATEQIMSKQAGYVSASVHRGLDGQHVTTYSQWRSQEDFDAMLRNPETQGLVERTRGLARYEPYLYQVVYSDSLAE